MTRNPKWVRDELILALDLYFRHNPAHISKTHPEVLALSHCLRHLNIHKGISDSKTFRNADGVYMKMSNFLRLDSGYKGHGLSRGSADEVPIWKEFSGDKLRLAKLAAAIRAAAKAAEPSTLLPTEQEDEEYPEGRVLFRQHRTHERNPKLVRDKKKEALHKSGCLRCEVCDFVYTHKYGALGNGYIECHHKLPVSKMPTGYKTTLKDLALVCADCHRMLHKGGETLTIEALRSLVKNHTLSGMPQVAASEQP